MIDEDVSEQIKEEVTAIEEVKVLVGLMQEIQAKEWMKMDYIVRNRWGPQLSQQQKEEIIREEWEEFQKQYETATSGLEGIDDSESIQEMPDQENIQEYLSTFTDSEYFQQTCDNDDDWKIKMVPISWLVARQSHVTVGTHQEIPSTEDDILGVIKYCLPTDSTNYLMVNQDRSPSEGTSVRFVSRNPNVNVTGPKIETLDDRPPGNLSVEFKIQARPNFIQIMHFNDRYFLHNGYHRTYQLMKQGETHVPAVIREAKNRQQAGLQNSLFTPDQLLSPRPPMVTDFDTDVAVNLEVKSTNKMIRIMAEKLDVNR